MPKFVVLVDLFNYVFNLNLFPEVPIFLREAIFLLRGYGFRPTRHSYFLIFEFAYFIDKIVDRIGFSLASKSPMYALISTFAESQRVDSQNFV